MVCAVAKIQFLDLTQLHKKVQVPVDGSQADIGEFFPDAGIKGICSRMIAAPGQSVLNGFTLSAVFQSFHGASFPQ